MNAMNELCVEDKNWFKDRAEDQYINATYTTKQNGQHVVRINQIGAVINAANNLKNC